MLLKIYHNRFLSSAVELLLQRLSFVAHPFYKCMQFAASNHWIDHCCVEGCHTRLHLLSCCLMLLPNGCGSKYGVSGSSLSLRQRIYILETIGCFEALSVGELLPKKLLGVVYYYVIQPQ